MSTDTPAPTMRERKQRATRERLLAVAQTLFAQRGYDGTTMDDIAADADVSRATAFNYFPRKEQLLLALIGACPAAIGEGLPPRRALRHAPDDLGQPAAAFVGNAGRRGDSPPIRKLDVEVLLAERRDVVLGRARRRRSLHAAGRRGRRQTAASAGR